MGYSILEQWRGSQNFIEGTHFLKVKRGTNFSCLDYSELFINILYC